MAQGGLEDCQRIFLCSNLCFGDVFFHLQSPWSHNNSFSPSPVKVHVSSVRSFRKLFPDSHDLSAHLAILKETKIITWAVITCWWYLYTGCWIIMNSTPQKKVVLTQTAVCIIISCPGPARRWDDPKWSAPWLQLFGIDVAGRITKLTTPKTLCQCWSS